MARAHGSLNDKQQRFVQEYLVDSNATQAAIRAGYSEKTANVRGSQLLAILSVREAVVKGQAKTAAKQEIDRDWLITRLKGIVAGHAVEQRDRISALREIGKLLGMYEQKILHRGEGFHLTLHMGGEKESKPDA